VGLYANLPATSSHLPTINKLLATSLSKGTWAGRSRTASAFMRSGKDPLSSLDRFLEQRLATVAPSTVTKDIGHLKWLLPRLLPKEDAEPMAHLLQDLQRGVRKADAGRPLTKALPISPTELRRLLVIAPLPVRALALLAFRTASRISDLLHLRPKDVTRNTDGLLVSFSITKTNQEAERRPDHRILVPDPPRDTVRWCLTSVRSPTLWTENHRQQLTQLLRHMRPDASVLRHWQEQDPQNIIRTHYTLHSFKRGAAALAWQGVVDGKITLQDLMLLLKHQDVKSALEYCPCPLLAAKAAGSTAAMLTMM
jgi:integrase